MLPERVFETNHRVREYNFADNSTTVEIDGDSFQPLSLFITSKATVYGSEIYEHGSVTIRFQSRRENSEESNKRYLSTFIWSNDVKEIAARDWATMPLWLSEIIEIIDSPNSNQPIAG